MSQKPRGFFHILAALCVASVLSGCGSTTSQAPTATPQADPTVQPNRPAVVTAAPTPEPTPTPTVQPSQGPITPYQFGA